MGVPCELDRHGLEGLAPMPQGVPRSQGTGCLPGFRPPLFSASWVNWTRNLSSSLFAPFWQHLFALHLKC